MSEGRYEVRDAEDGSFYFVLIASNGEVLSTSETYTRKEDAERAIGDAGKAAAEAVDESTSADPPPSD
jgi:uncharacterized protein YegP (UPF0339 family)